jgi:anti-sigma B factor antagonist
VSRHDQPQLDLRYSDDSDPPVLAVAGELDLGSAPALRETFLRLLGDPAVPDVAIDLGGVTFLDSSGLAVLLMAARRWTAEERRLVVRNPSDVVMRVVDLTGARQAFLFEE